MSTHPCAAIIVTANFTRREIFSKLKMGRRNKPAKAKRKVTKSQVATNKPATGLSAGSSDGQAKYTVEQLSQKVEECMDCFNYELAEKFCARALDLCPGDVKLLEMAGVVALELGHMDAATQFFTQAVELAPESGHSKYMYLGQLLTGSKAIDCFMKGIALLKTQLESQAQHESAQAKAVEPVSVRDLSSAYCSVAELYLTDACMEDNAESECEKCLQEAILHDQTNPEAHHLQASFYLSTGNNQAACGSIEQGMSLWLPQLKEAEKPDGDSLDEVNVCPVSYPARVNVAKILIELEKYDVATEVLELLLDEEDTVVEVWYLLGWANHLQGEEYTDTARYYLQKAQQVSKKSDCGDVQLLSHITELLAELGPEPEMQDPGEIEILTDSEDDAEEEGMEH